MYRYVKRRTLEPVVYFGLVTNRRSVARIVGAGFVVLSLAAATQRTPAPPQASVPDQLQRFVPVTDEMLLQPQPENWISFRNGYSLWGYSSLSQIHVGNVGELRLVWSRAMQQGYQEVEPTVYDGVMFLANVQDIVQALDATTGDLLWEYRRDLPDNIANVTGTRYRYRNVSIYDDKIFLATNDAYLVALDARTGEVVWETQRADYRERVAQTAGPVIVKGKVITGSRCNPSSPRPGGCFITAHDVRTGQELWRVNTAATPDQPGGDTWGGLPVSARRHASAWMVGSYDPELDLVYWGTGPPAPLPEKLRGAGKADLLYTNSTLALDPDTGEMMWYFQHLPRDNWDLDHVFERIIVETQVFPNPDDVPWISPNLRAGETRKVITGIPGKTGLVWTLDAATGGVLVGATHRVSKHHDRARAREWSPDHRRIHDAPVGGNTRPRVSQHTGRQEPAIRGLQPGYQCDLHAVEQRVYGPGDVCRRRGTERRLRHSHSGPSCPRRGSGDGSRRACRGGVGVDRRDTVELPAACAGLWVAARDGWQPRLFGAM